MDITLLLNQLLLKNPYKVSHMAREKTLFYALVGIGAILVILSTTGYLNNATNLTIAILFAVFAIGLASLYEFREPEIMIQQKRPMFEEKVVG